jgi:hypothetical protein
MKSLVKVSLGLKTVKWRRRAPIQRLRPRAIPDWDSQVSAFAMLNPECVWHEKCTAVEVVHGSMRRCPGNGFFDETDDGEVHSMKKLTTVLLVLAIFSVLTARRRVGARWTGWWRAARDAKRIEKWPRRFRNGEWQYARNDAATTDDVTTARHAAAKDDAPTAIEGWFLWWASEFEPSPDDTTAVEQWSGADADAATAFAGWFRTRANEAKGPGPLW